MGGATEARAPLGKTPPPPSAAQVNNLLPLHNTALLAEYAELEPCLKPLVRKARRARFRSTVMPRCVCPISHRFQCAR